MKKGILLFLFVLLIPSFVLADEVYKIDMKVNILKDGTANITEVWDVMADDEDTSEWYKQMDQLGNSEVKNFEVLMDGKELKEKSWDIGETREGKAGYYGINYTSDGIELCFGSVDDERHQFTLNYTITNFIYNTFDSQVLYWTLIPKLNMDVDEFKISVDSYYEFSDTLDVWGYGYDGYVYVVDGKIEMNHPYYGLDDDEYVVLLAKFPLNTFETKNTYDGYNYFDDVYDDASYGVEEDDYNYDYDEEDLVNDMIGLAGVMVVVALIIGLISLAFSIYSFIVLWKLFVKAGEPGWAVFVPFYNMYVLYKITWGNGWIFLTTFLAIIPVVGAIAVLVINILTYVKLAKSFGKDGGFAVGLIFLNIIFLSILAFDKSEYLGVFKDNNSTNNNSNDMAGGTIYCASCGTKLDNNVLFCPNCGTRK